MKLKKLVKIKEEKLENFDVNIADNFKSRLKGLMFKKHAKTPLLFEIPKSDNRKRSAIHTCFMRFEITIVFIGFDNKIFEIANLKPWKFYTPQKPAKYVIEFNKNDFYNYDLKVDDEIDLKDDDEKFEIIYDEIDLKVDDEIELD